MIILYILSILCTFVITYIVAAYLFYIGKIVKQHIVAKKIIIKQSFKVSFWFGIRYFLPIVFASSGDLMEIVDGITKDKKTNE